MMYIVNAVLEQIRTRKILLCKIVRQLVVI